MKLCLVCDARFDGTGARCPQHAIRRPSPTKRGYDAEYQRNAAQVRREWKRLGLPCAICGRPFAVAETISVDHRVARSKGGSNALENLFGTHAKCNAGKRDRLNYRPPTLGRA